MAGHEISWPLIGQMLADGGLWLADVDIDWLLLCPGDSCQPHYPGLWSHHHYHYHNENQRTHHTTPFLHCQSVLSMFIQALHLCLTFNNTVEKKLRNAYKSNKIKQNSNSPPPKKLLKMETGKKTDSQTDSLHYWYRYPECKWWVDWAEGDSS